VKRMIGNKIQSVFKHILTKLGSLGLAKKLFFSYVVIIAVPIIIFGIYTLRVIKTSAETDLLNTNLHMLREEVLNINKNMLLCERVAQTLISDKEFVEFVGEKREASSDEIVAFKIGPLERIEKIPNIYPDIYKIRLFLDNPHFDEIWPAIYNENWITKSKWRDDVLQRKGMVFWRLNHREETFQTIQDEGRDVVSLYREIQYPQSRHLGIVEVSMLSKEFFRQMYSASQDAASIQCIINNNKEVFFNENKQSLGKNAPDMPVLKALLESNTRGEEGSFPIQIKEMRALVVYRFIDSLDSYMYQITSMDAISRKLGSVRNVVVVGILGLIALLSIVTFFITSILLKKLRIIIAHMRKVQNGEMFIDIPILGNDEIGELSHHFQKMLHKVNESIFSLVRKQAATKDAEIRALQTQINAHFIYNVLEAIKTQAEIDYKYDMADSITALGRLMRYSMEWSTKYVTLKEELGSIKNYIALMNLRYGNEIDVHYDISEGLLSLEVLKMTIQPLAENAINHGLEPREGGGTLWIKAYSSENHLYIEVMDNGVGMSPEELEALQRSIQHHLVEDTGTAKASSGIGLRNVNERIKLFYGEEYGIDIASKKDEFTRVRVILPCRNAWGGR
jgi:two-component system, sensor histidine kinase YesM